MKKNQMDSVSFSEQEDQLLQTFFDSEASAANTVRVVQFIEQNANARAYYHGFSLLRRWIQGSHEARLREGTNAYGRVDLWERIAPQLVESRSSVKTQRMSVTEMLYRVSNSISAMLFRPVTATAASVAILGVAFNFYQEDSVVEPSAITLSPFEVRLEADESATAALAKSAENAQEFAPLFIPETTVVSYRGQINDSSLQVLTEPSRQRILARELIRDDFVLAELRAQGADSDWIRNSKAENLSVDWRDLSGDALLATKTHVPQWKNVVLGTDSNTYASTFQVTLQR